MVQNEIIRNRSNETPLCIITHRFSLSVDLYMSSSNFNSRCASIDFSSCAFKSRIYFSRSSTETAAPVIGATVGPCSYNSVNSTGSNSEFGDSFSMGVWWLRWSIDSSHVVDYKDRQVLIQPKRDKERFKVSHR